MGYSCRGAGIGQLTGRPGEPVINEVAGWRRAGSPRSWVRFDRRRHARFGGALGQGRRLFHLIAVLIYATVTPEKWRVPLERHPPGVLHNLIYLPNPIYKYPGT